MADEVFAWFPGQGVQTLGMGKRLAAKSAPAKAVLDEASEALGFDLPALLWDSSDEDLARTENAQPAIVAVSVANFRAWRAEEGSEVPLTWVAGHSIGALSAAICGGWLDFGEGISLARARGELMAAAPGSGGMLAVSVSGDDARAQCVELAAACDLDVASYNGPRQLVLSGESSAIARAQEQLGARSKLLNVSHAFHSRMMQPAVEPWHAELDSAHFHQGELAYVGSCHEGRADGVEQVQLDLADALRNPVRWDSVIHEAESAHSGYAFGSGRGLVRMWRKRPRSLQVTIIDDLRTERM